MQGNRRGALVVFGVLVVSAILGGIYGPPVRATSSDVNDLQDSVKTFTHVLAIVQKNYAVPVDADHAVYEGAIPGMLRVLDPHSTFFDARAFTDIQENQVGHYFGVGMTIAQRGNEVYVVAPMVGSPAYKAGIRPDDVVVAVDGKSTTSMGSPEVADLLKGPKGTEVKVSMKREGAPQPIVFELTRDEIPRHSVDIAFDIRPGIGYIKLSGFNETTDQEMTEALNQLQPSTLDGLILDLRGNPGGLLNAAVAVGDKFLDKNQLIVSHHGRASQERRYYAMRGNRGDTIPLVILVNGNTASASEIVSGAIQDHDRGLIVGDETFGKGLVQTVSGLSEDTGLALTTARYYTPSGRLIQRDYKDTSLYDYLYNHNNPPVTEIKLTDSGRHVTGGGGITPDIVVPEPKLTPFDELMLRRDVFFAFQGGVGGFTPYFLSTKPTVAKDFVVDDSVMSTFRKYLDDQHLKYTEAEIDQDLPWIKREIKKEVFISVFGLTDGIKVDLENDPQLDKAIASLPQARALYDNARKIVAERTPGASLQR